MGELPQRKSPRASHSSNRTCLPVEFLVESPQGGLNFSFGACEDHKLSVAASEGRLEPSEAEDSPGPPPPDVAAYSEADAVLTTMLSRAATSIRLKWTTPPCLVHDDWFLESECNALPLPGPRSA